MRRIFVTRGLVERGPALPLFVRWRHKWPAGLATCGVALAMYALPNRIHAFAPRELPLNWVDRAVPFVPWTIWIYWSGVLFIAVAYVANRCLVSMNKHLYSFLALVAVSAVVFFVAPTTYPRDLYPIPPGTGSATRAALEFMRGIDRPSNCAPSLHVSLAYLIALGFLEDRLYHPWPFLFMFSWATAMAVSTMTTKQHYAFDVLTGLAMAVLFFWLFHIRLRYRLTEGVRAETGVNTLS